jgi:DNA repair photolyase
VHLLLCPPTHSYLNFSPGLDFETQIVASKHNIAEVLRSELAQPRYVPRLVNIGSATDCYQPVERELKLTRSLIEVMQQARHPFSLITKSSGVSATWICWPPGRAAPGGGLRHHHHARPGTGPPNGAARRRAHRRLRTIRALADAGVPVGVSVAPQIRSSPKTWNRCWAAHEAGAFGLLHRAAPAVGAGFAVP